MLGLLGLSDAVIAQSAPYMRLMFVGQIALGFQMMAGHALGAAGDTLTPMKAGIVVRVIQLPLSPLLVFGLFGLPALGLPGAALASILAHVVSLVYLSAVLLRGSSRLHLVLHAYRPDPQILRQLVRVGWPASVNGMERTIAQLSFGFIVAPFGDLAYAAFTVTRRAEMFATWAPWGWEWRLEPSPGRAWGRASPSVRSKPLSGQLVSACSSTAASAH